MATDIENDTKEITGIGCSFWILICVIAWGALLIALPIKLIWWLFS